MNRSKRWCLALLATLRLVVPAWAHGDEGAGPSQVVMKRLFPAAESFVTRPVKLDAAARKRLGSLLGSPLEGHDLTSPAYIPVAGGQSLGIVWATDAHLKEGLVDVIVGVDRQGKVVGVALQHSPVATLAQSSYLKQYTGKTAGSAFRQGGDLKPLAGNPAASLQVSRAVRKSVVLVNAAFLGGSK